MFSPKDIREKDRQIARIANIFTQFKMCPLDIVTKLINNQLDVLPINQYPVFKADASTVNDVPPQITRCLPEESIALVKRTFRAKDIHSEIERYGTEYSEGPQKMYERNIGIRIQRMQKLTIKKQHEGFA